MSRGLEALTARTPVPSRACGCCWQVRDIPGATLDHPLTGKKMNHGVILKVLATNICGSDQHMVRGRTTAPAGLILGHEVGAASRAHASPLPPGEAQGRNAGER